jgi:choline dehydrogenase-like flavoprotein
MREDFDVVIIGSGGGGAPVAHELAKAGKSVLVLEKGPLLQPQYLASSGVSGFKRDEMYSTGAEKRIQMPEAANNGASYYCSHVEPDINDEPHVYRDGQGQDKVTIEGYTAQVVGGGTQLYGAVSYRFTPTDFRLQSFNANRPSLPNDPNDDVKREARDWPVSYEEMEPYYCKAEELVGLNGEHANQIKPFSRKTYQPPLDPNPISAHVVDGMTKLGMVRYRTPLAVITRDHPPSNRKGPNPPESAKTAYVNRYGDPMGFKSSAYVALLAPIMSLDNFVLRPNCLATHLESSSDGKVKAVHYLDPGGQPRIARGKIVVVSCSAIESVRLLMLSAREDAEFDRRINNTDLLGAYFLTHCFGGASAMVAEPARYDKSLTLDSDWSTDHCAREAYLIQNGLWAGAAIYNNTSDRALPLALARNHQSRDLDSVWAGFVQDSGMVGEKMKSFLDHDFGRGLSVTFMANQMPLKTNRIALHPTVTDKWNRPAAYIIKGWHPHDVYLMNYMAGICADLLRAGGVDDQLGFGAVYGNDDLARCANHILGGARFGNDPKDSVLDRNCRAWQFDNLYVVDGAFMPTSGGANPTLTIQANAFRVADHLKTVV